MPKKSSQSKTYTKSFESAGVVSPDGSVVRMSDGSVFKRTVIPSKYSKPDESADLEDFDAIPFFEEGSEDQI